ACASRRSRCRLIELPQLSGQSRHLARAGVLVDHALGDGPHQLRLGLHEGALSGGRIARGDGLVKTAQVGADARAARLVDFGAAGDLADRLLGAGRVGHVSALQNGSAPEGASGRGKLEARIYGTVGRGSTPATPPGRENYSSPRNERQAGRPVTRSAKA